MRVGTAQTWLVVVRGNSASGKSTVAATIRERFGRGPAPVGRDNLRRVVLRERDRPGAANTGPTDVVPGLRASGLGKDDAGHLTASPDGLSGRLKSRAARKALE